MGIRLYPGGRIAAIKVTVSKRKLLGTLVRYGVAIVLVAFLYTLVDFAVDFRPGGIQDAYQFRLRDVVADRARILRQDNLAILVIKRSEATVARLQRSATGLQDPESARSNQPGYARNRLRSRYPPFFVSYARGTDLGCPLRIFERELGEACGPARYDFAGRALQGPRKFPNLVVPDYNFNRDFSVLTIEP